MKPRRLRRDQSGAALLIAMIIVALVATLASAMVWQQWRAVQVESVERARTQSAWILNGGSDFARFILREDNPNVDYIGEPWSLGLKEARISSFLSADKENTDDSAEAFFAGVIVDAQSRYNLRNIANIEADALPGETKRLSDLLDNIGLNGGDLAPRLAFALRAAFQVSKNAGNAANPTGVTAPLGTYLQPQTIDQLAWFGIDDDTIARLKPYVIILPITTKVNVNTAPKEVLAAVAGIDVGTAQQWVQQVQRAHWENLVDSIGKITPGLNAAQMAIIGSNLDIKSNYFEVHGRVRLQDRVLEETSLMRRDTATRLLTPILRRRETLRDTGG